VSEGLGGRLRAVEVALHHVVPAYDDLAALAGRQQGAVRGHDRDALAGECDADGAELAPTGGRVGGAGTRRLGQAVALDQWEAEPLLRCLQELLAGRRRATDREADGGGVRGDVV